MHDLDAAAAFYRSLGFQVGARNRHAPSWGTQNHIVQLGGSFIELLTVAEPAGIAPHGPRSFRSERTIATRWRAARGSMLVLEGHDAQADARAFREAGIGDFDVFDFEREGRRPDGAPIKVAFSLAFARVRPRRRSVFSPASRGFRTISGIRNFKCISMPQQASPGWSW